MQSQGIQHCTLLWFVLLQHDTVIAVVQVPPPVDKVLPWETLQEDGSIVSTVSEDAEGDGILSVVVGTLGHLVRKAASALGRKLHIV